MDAENEIDDDKWKTVCDGRLLSTAVRERPTENGEPSHHKRQ